MFLDNNNRLIHNKQDAELKLAGIASPSANTFQHITFIINTSHSIVQRLDS